MKIEHEIKKIMNDKMCEEKEKIRLEAIKEMEMQLHEQFSVNYNSTYSTTIALFCSLLAVLYGYGYVFVHSSLAFSKDLGTLFCNARQLYSLDVLVFASIVTFVVLTVIMYICIYQGVSQRLEQFLVYAIRSKYYNTPKSCITYPKIYPKGYMPFFKDRDGIIVGMYGQIVSILGKIQVFILICTGVKLFSCENFKLCQFSWNKNSLELAAMIIIIIFCYCLIRSLKKKMHDKYRDRSLEYLVVLKDCFNVDICY